LWLEDPPDWFRAGIRLLSLDSELSERFGFGFVLDAGMCMAV
jgi:hypothetical protein